MSLVIVHKVRMGPMPGNPFPDAALVQLGDLIAEAAADPVPAGEPPFAFIGMSDVHMWVRCECPWWHSLPFVSRRVHEDLP